MHTDPGREEAPSGCHHETKLPSRCHVAVLTGEGRSGASGLGDKHLSSPCNQQTRFLVFDGIDLINIHGRAVLGAGAQQRRGQ